MADVRNTVSRASYRRRKARSIFSMGWMKPQQEATRRPSQHHKSPRRYWRTTLILWFPVPIWWRKTTWLCRQPIRKAWWLCRVKERVLTWPFIDVQQDTRLIWLGLQAWCRLCKTSRRRRSISFEFLPARVLLPALNGLATNVWNLCNTHSRYRLIEKPSWNWLAYSICKHANMRHTIRKFRWATMLSKTLRSQIMGCPSNTLLDYKLVVEL